MLVHKFIWRLIGIYLSRKVHLSAIWKTRTSATFCVS